MSIALYTLFAPVAEGAQPEGRGFIPGDTKGDCWYSQNISDSGYFVEFGISRLATMTFEDPTCLRATWGNKFLINSKIAKPYAQPWVKFDHAEFERSGRAQRQVKGFCIPAKNASMIVVMVDYKIKDGYITHVMHARGIPPCGT